MVKERIKCRIIQFKEDRKRQIISKMNKLVTVKTQEKES